MKKKLGVTLQGKHADFRVWAPFAKSVAISGTFTPDGPLEMTSEADGYWHTRVKDVEPGQQYRYLITTPDGKVLEKNDPRARAITRSDKGFSVIVDDAFDWVED
ncbi:MAG: 1,4-alpha-glucan branching protein, partial [Acidobacteriota bacterium]